MKNIIEKEFTTVGTININLDLDGDWMFHLIIYLNGNKKEILLGAYDSDRPDFDSNVNIREEYKTNLLDRTTLQSLYNKSCLETLKINPIIANVTGKYVFDMDNPENDHVKIESVSCMDEQPDASVTYSKEYTGNITSIERKHGFIIITLDTTDIKFECPMETFNPVNLAKPIVVSVNERIMPSIPREYIYTVTDVKSL